MLHRVTQAIKHRRTSGWAAVKRVPDSELYGQWSTPGPVFSPWLGTGTFSRLYAGIKEHTLVSADRCYILASLAIYAGQLQGGDAAECGVYAGGTALMLARVFSDGAHRLHLFDSFQGLPKPDPAHDEFLEEGQFQADAAPVRELLSDHQWMTEIHEGWIPDTFAGLEDERFCFAHIDVDAYRSALDCCEYFYPRLVSGGVMVFDEYGFPDAHGERDAVDEYFADKREAPIALMTGQAFVLRLPDAPTAEQEARE